MHGHDPPFYRTWATTNSSTFPLSQHQRMAVPVAVLTIMEERETALTVAGMAITLLTVLLGNEILAHPSTCCLTFLSHTLFILPQDSWQQTPQLPTPTTLTGMRVLQHLMTTTNLMFTNHLTILKWQTYFKTCRPEMTLCPTRYGRPMLPQYSAAMSAESLPAMK